MAQKKATAQISVETIAEQCIAVRLRMLSRAVTRIYNQALRPYGLTTSQMNILVAISCLGEARQHDVCQALHLEKSTLSRDVARMRSQGWLDVVPGEDGRTALLRITPVGRSLLEQAIPAWQQAQEQATALLGEREVRTFGQAATTLRVKSTTTRR
jgi:DNA-binding MarR family transcriptional regulator